MGTDTKRTSWCDLAERKTRTWRAAVAYEDEARIAAFRELVHRPRAEAGLTEAELAERMGTTQPAIARMEGGHPADARHAREARVCPRLDRQARPRRAARSYVERADADSITELPDPRNPPARRSVDGSVPETVGPIRWSEVPPRSAMSVCRDRDGGFYRIFYRTIRNRR